MRKMREGMIIEVIMKRSWVHCTRWPSVKATRILPSEQVGVGIHEHRDRPSGKCGIENVQEISADCFHFINEIRMVIRGEWGKWWRSNNKMRRYNIVSECVRENWLRKYIRIVWQCPLRFVVINLKNAQEIWFCYSFHPYLPTQIQVLSKRIEEFNRFGICYMSLLKRESTFCNSMVVIWECVEKGRNI